MLEKILIVDDERGIRETLRGVLEDEDFIVSTAVSGEECLEAVKQNSFSCILLDIWLGSGIDGLKTLERLTDSGSDAAVVMISGHGNIETAVRSTKLGAFDFIEKPLSLERTILTVKNAIRQRKLEQANKQLRRELAVQYEMVGESIAIRRSPQTDIDRRSDRRTRPDLRRERHGQGTRRTCDSQSIASFRCRIRRDKFRRDP